MKLGTTGIFEVKKTFSNKKSIHLLQKLSALMEDSSLFVYNHYFDHDVLPKSYGKHLHLEAFPVGRRGPSYVALDNSIPIF